MSSIHLKNYNFFNVLEIKYLLSILYESRCPIRDRAPLIRFWVEVYFGGNLHLTEISKLLSAEALVRMGIPASPLIFKPNLRLTSST